MATIQQDLTYFLVGIRKQISDVKKIKPDVQTQIGKGFCNGKLQALTMAESGIANILKKEDNRRKRAEKYGPKKVGRKKKPAINQTQVNKYGWI